jgi:hypothetical protein
MCGTKTVTVKVRIVEISGSHGDSKHLWNVGKLLPDYTTFLKVYTSALITLYILDNTLLAK